MFGIRNRRKRSIRFRLMLDIGIILVVTCVFNYLLVKFIYQGILEKQNSEKKELVAHVAVKQAQLINENAHGLLNNVLKTIDIDDEPHIVREKLKQIKVFTTKFKDIIVLDLNGIGTGIYQEYYDLRGKSTILRVENGEQISFNILEQEGIPYIVFGQVIKEESGAERGILLGIQEVEVFFDQIMQVSGGEICFLGNSSGDGFMSVGQKGTPDRIRILSNDKGIQWLFSEGIVAGNDYTIETEKGGYCVKVNYGKVDGTEWMLGVISCTNEIGSILKDFKIAMIIGMAVVISIGLGIIYFVTSSVVKRITNISTYIEGNIENEFKDPIPKELLENEDELGKLAREMKKLGEVVEDMLLTVKDSVNYLNDKVIQLNHERVQGNLDDSSDNKTTED